MSSGYRDRERSTSPTAFAEDASERPVSREVELEVESVSSNETRAAPRPEDRRAHQEMTVLVVDDDEDMRKYVRRSLRHMGDLVSRVIEAENGMRALEQIEAASVALVISDVLMPVMDGYELSRVIKERSRDRRLPVLLITGEGTRREVEGRARTVGAHGVLIKPFNAHDLCRAVEDVLGQSTPGGEDHR